MSAPKPNDQFRLLVASVRDYAIFMLDPDGFVQTWNAGAEAIKGYSEAEIVGRHFSTFYTQADRDREHPQHELEVAAREGRFEEEGWRVRRDGETFWANVVITALRDEGELVGFAKVTRDLTERRAAQEALRATAEELARSNAELERFALAAAHDLVEPLQTMAGFADLIERRYGERLDDDGRAFLGQITDGARRMRNLIDGLLRYARASQAEVHLQPVDVAQAVESVVRNLHSALASSGGALHYDAPSLPCVLADEDLLVNVLQNLVANALKFAGQAAPNVTVSAERQDGDRWRITVADDGVGIAAADQERIFAMFGRAHPPGAAQPGVGLGLALCDRLITRLGGTIGVDSEPGAGSRFWFTLADGAAARSVRDAV
jgi:PAS domain S-box-containing protein